VTLALRASGPSSLRYLSAASDDYSRRIGRISSGLRIVRAADDAAGLAIAHKLRAHVNGSATASRNVHDAINLLGTAEGGLQGVTSLLQRARELSVQAASTGTMTASDREAAAAEVRQIVAEVDRIAGATQYNGMRLLDGSRPAGFSFHVGASADDALTVRIADMDATALGLLGGGALSGTLSTVTTYETASRRFNNWQIDASRDTFVFTVDGVETTVTLAAATYDQSQLMDFRKDFNTALKAAGVAVTVGLVKHDNGDVNFTFTADAGTTTEVTVTGDGAAALEIATTSTTTTTVSATTATVALADLVAAGSGEAMEVVDAALALVSGQRTSLGAAQNRLEHRLGVLAATEQNLGAARSRIEDADIAVEYAALVRAQILGQAGMAMQSQQATGGRRVLQLLSSL
jgi:flagellin